MKPAFVVDADAHLMEQVPALRKYLPDAWQKRTVWLPSDGFDRSYGGELGQHPTSPREHLDAMDTEGIDLAVMYPTRGWASVECANENGRWRTARPTTIGWQNSAPSIRTA